MHYTQVDWKTSFTNPVNETQIDHRTTFVVPACRSSGGDVPAHG